MSKEKPCPYVTHELTKLLQQAEPRGNKYLSLSYKQVDEIITDYFSRSRPIELKALDKEKVIALFKAIKWKTISENNIPIIADLFVETFGVPDVEWDKLADFIEQQIAFDLEAALIDGKIKPENYVIENRKSIRQIIDACITAFQKARGEK